MGEKGFTLIEIIISIFLLGIVVISIFPMLSNSLDTIISSDRKTSSINSAENELIKKLSDFNAEDISIKEVELQVKDKDNTDNVISMKAQKYIIQKSYKKPSKLKEEKVNIIYYKYIEESE